MVKDDDYLPGDERWDIDDLSGTRNEDGTWDVMIRARVRLADEVGAQAAYVPAASLDHGLAGIGNVITNTVARALVDGAADPVTFLEATVGIGRDDFGSARRGN